MSDEAMVYTFSFGFNISQEFKLCICKVKLKTSEEFVFFSFGASFGDRF